MQKGNSARKIVVPKARPTGPKPTRLGPTGPKRTGSEKRR